MSAFGQTFSAPSLLTEKAGEESFYVRFLGVNKAKKLLGPRGGRNYCREREERDTEAQHISVAPVRVSLAYVTTRLLLLLLLLLCQRRR